MSTTDVRVVRFSDRKYLQLQYIDPVTGKKKTKSSGTTIRREAERAAAKLEKEIQEGKYKQIKNISWEDFRRRYEEEVLPGLAEETGRVLFTVFNTVEQILSPSKLLHLNAERLSYYQSVLRKEGRSESTNRTYLAHLRSALKWADRVKLITSVPEIQFPKRVKRGKLMKGRPITTEEFERMLKAIREVVGDRASQSWDFYLRGLWFSGLRLAESLELWWDRDDRLRVDLSAKRPMLQIPGELEKGNEDRLLPMAPEFAEFLLSVPKKERTGRVFRLLRKDGTSQPMRSDWVGRIISRLGKAASIKVHTNVKTGRVKYASAHDLRRSFGARWAPRVMPHVLMQLMRHESIETTLKYYVERNAQMTADVLWTAHGDSALSNTFGNTPPNSPIQERSPKNPK